MRLAVIDCGTNTFNLIVTDVNTSGKYTKVFQTRISVKLGEGAINKGYIARAPFRRGLDALGALKKSVDKHRVDKVLAFATSAIRDASNGPEFVRSAQEQYGIGLTVIDGNREAELIYLGTREAVNLDQHISLIMDIGGGSTEFILASRDKIFWKQSFKLGAARLLEKIKPSDPVSQTEMSVLNDYLEAQLAPLIESAARHQPAELIGSSGAFDSLVEMIHGELGGEPLMDTKTEYEVNTDHYVRVSELVRASTLEKRRQIKGLTPMRIDMIVISCLLIDFIITRLALRRLRVSIYSLKEGALADFVQREALKTGKDHGKNTGN